MDVAQSFGMRLRRVVLAAMGLGLTAWALLAWAIHHEGRAPREMYRVDAHEVIVVLGARVDQDGRASPTLKARVEHAVKRLASSPPGTVLLFSGGVGTYGASEASVARELALQLGVPAHRCLVEEESHSTLQNAVFSLRLIRSRFPRGAHVIVVSDPYHLARARRLLEGLAGRTVSTSPVLEAPRDQFWLSRVWWTLREVPALAKDLVLMHRSEAANPAAAR